MYHQLGHSQTSRQLNLPNHVDHSYHKISSRNTLQLRNQ